MNSADERPQIDGVNWIGDAYPVNADPERDTWNGQPMTARPSLVEFLLARIAEDEERVNQAIGTTPWAVNPPNLFHGIAVRHLGDCEAKRRIIEDHHVECSGHPGPWMRHGDYGPGYCGREDESNETLLALAMPYADHPDYREEWRA